MDGRDTAEAKAEPYVELVAESAETEQAVAVPLEEPANDVVPLEDLFTRSRRVMLRPRTSGSGGLWFVLLFVLFVVGQLADLKSPVVIANLITVILVHEMGHALGMKMFGFSDVRMFFIPGLGAAVSGHGRGVAAWKEAVVSLLGPVPGIALGAVGFCYFATNPDPYLADLCQLTLWLNLFNLLPMGSLDGGRFLQRTLFSRHPVLDVGFQLIGTAALIAVALAGQAVMLLLFTIPALFALPNRYRVLKSARALTIDRALLVRDPSTLEATELREAYEAARETLPAEGRDNPQYVGERMADMLEAAKAPPRLLATALLIGVYVVSLAVGAFAAVLISHENAEPKWTWVTQPGWKLYFPQEPSTLPSTERTPSGPIPGVQIRAATKGAQRFRVSVVKDAAASPRERWVELARAEVLEEQDEYRLQATRETKLAGLPATELEFQHSGRTLWVRVLVTGGYRYALATSAPRWSEQQQRFFESFALSPPRESPRL